MRSGSTWERPVDPPGIWSIAATALPLGVIKPRGWLRRQLEIQASGLSGHLDEFWPDVKESGWIGGAAEGWERAPYWLDGLVPLAFLLEDERLIEKVERWIGYILDHQAEDGWLGPQSQEQNGFHSNRDPWPIFVILKVLTQYAEARDQDVPGTRVYKAILRALRAIDTHLDHRPLYDWNQLRWGDLLITILWCRARVYDTVLGTLAERIHNQGYDWESHFQRFPFRYRSTSWAFDTHVVNNAMGIKTPGLWEVFTTGTVSADAVLEPIAVLDEFHGQANGMFSGDECLAGKVPSQGTELCAVVEYLFSLEQLLPYQADVRISDRLELIAYNALPATFSPDMWAHQYDQQVNQVRCAVTEDPVYTTNGPESNIYGLEPNFGCCTANMHQGFPKFAASLWVRTQDQSLRATTYAPCEVTVPTPKASGASQREIAHRFLENRRRNADRQPREGETTIRVETDYPLREDVRIVVEFSPSTEPAIPTLAIDLPIPTWAEGATVAIDGSSPSPADAGQIRRVELPTEGRHEINLHLPMEVRVERRYNEAVSIYRGPLLFALRPEERWTHLRGEQPHADWEVTPASPWAKAIGRQQAKSWGLVAKESGEVTRALTDMLSSGPTPGHTPGGQRDAGASPTPEFTVHEPPVAIPVWVKRCEGWALDRGAAAPPPNSPLDGEGPEEAAVLVPYGATGLRVAEIPWYSKG